MAVTLASGISAIQDGSAFKSPPASVNGLTSFGLQVGNDAAASITQSWGSATSNLSTALSVAQTKTKVTQLKAKSEGREPTPEELDEACGPLAFLANAGSALDDALGGIFTQVGEFASDFGQSIGAFAAQLNGLIADVANAVDEIAQEIAEAALAAFEAVNSAAIAALEAVEGAINAAVGAINGVIQSVEAAIDSAINELLAFADGLNFASIFSLDCQKEAVANAVDSEKVADTAEVNRVLTPTIVSETDSTITSETLPEPQTIFEPTPSTAPPPNLDNLIKEYQTAARAFKASVDEVAVAIAQGRRSSVTRAQQNELDLAQRDALQRLREAAASEGVDIDTLPIYGPNFDSQRTWVKQREGRDRNGDLITTSRAVYTPTR